MITSSLDKNQPIYISENGREELFAHILEEEKSKNFDDIWGDIKDLYDYMFSAENLERYCLGAIGRADYAYKKIGKLLRKEYEEWKVNQCSNQIFKDAHGIESMKVAVICDNKEQYNSYMKSHKDCTQCEYIYVDNNNLPHGIELDDVVDLRELTRIIRARLKPEWLMKNTGFGGLNDKTSNN